MKAISKIVALIAVVVAAVSPVRAQKSDFNPVQTGINSLDIAPDARSAGMGELGAATDPDANSQFWNPSKYAFAPSRGEVSLSYTPWLRKIIDDIFLANVSGYWKIGSYDMQAISATLRYFSLGEVTTSYPGAQEASQTLNPYEMAFDIGYSRKLSEKYSMGVVLRYIYSDLAFGSDPSQSDGGNSGASAFSADISGYYTTYPVIGRSECQLSWGWNISNIGSKLNYADQTAFLPTNLRLGANFTFPLADYHNLSIGLDLNKLLVPTKPRMSDFEGEGKDELEVEREYEDALTEWENRSPIAGIFKSFSDAPGGFKEELKEIMVSLGAEYSYNRQFFLRTGYFYENASKGNRKYFSMGAGFHTRGIGLDASYMIATAQTSPLDQTLRLTLTFDFDGIKQLLGRD